MVWFFTFNQDKEAIKIQRALKCMMRCLKPLPLEEKYDEETPVFVNIFVYIHL